MTTNLVKGYMTEKRFDEEMRHVFVRHVAVFEDGTVKRTIGTIRFTYPSFDDGFDWETIEQLPADAEFIGNYPATM